jgi:hypothetical protein
MTVLGSQAEDEAGAGLEGAIVGVWLYTDIHGNLLLNRSHHNTRRREIDALPQVASAGKQVPTPRDETLPHLHNVPSTQSACADNTQAAQGWHRPLQPLKLKRAKRNNTTTAAFPALVSSRNLESRCSTQ